MNVLPQQQKQPSALRYPMQWSALLLIYITIWIPIVRDTGRLSGMYVHATNCILSSHHLTTAIWPTLTTQILLFSEGHTHLTHQYLLCGKEPPQCPFCNCALTLLFIYSSNVNSVTKLDRNTFLSLLFSLGPKAQNCAKIHFRCDTPAIKILTPGLYFWGCWETEKNDVGQLDQIAKLSEVWFCDAGSRLGKSKNLGVKCQQLQNG